MTVGKIDILRKISKSWQNILQTERLKQNALIGIIYVIKLTKIKYLSVK